MGRMLEIGALGQQAANLAGGLNRVFLQLGWHVLYCAVLVLSRTSRLVSRYLHRMRIVWCLQRSLGRNLCLSYLPSAKLQLAVAVVGCARQF